MKTTYKKSFAALCLVMANSLEGFSISNAHDIMQNNINIGYRDINSISQFTATAKNNQIELSWQTITASNLNCFIIEKSNNGTIWTEIGSVKAMSNTFQATNYQYTDSLPTEGTQYYRLKEIYLNGNKTSSGVIFVTYSTTEESLVHVYPNPATEYIVIHLKKNQYSPNYSIKLLNSIGRLLEDFGTIYENELQINISNQPANIYYIEIRNDNSTKQLKFIKN